jgi:hypothetical protein
LCCKMSLLMLLIVFQRSTDVSCPGPY